MNTLTERLDGLTARTKEERGFTLVELLVVILIIGILAAIAIPAFLNQRQRANDAAVESDIRNIAITVDTMLTANPNADNIEVTTRAGGTGTLIASTAIPSANFARIAVDDDVETFIVSGDVRVTGEGDAQGYKLWATHNNGKDYNFSDDTWVLYDSNKGGLQKGAVSGDGVVSPGGDEGGEGGDEGGEGNEEDNGDGTANYSEADAQAEFERFVAAASASAPAGAVTADYVLNGSIRYKDNTGNQVGDEVPYEAPEQVMGMRATLDGSEPGYVMTPSDTFYFMTETDGAGNEPELLSAQEYDAQYQAFHNWAQDNMLLDAQRFAYDGSSKEVTWHDGGYQGVYSYDGFHESVTGMNYQVDPGRGWNIVMELADGSTRDYSYTFPWV